MDTTLESINTQLYALVSDTYKGKEVIESELFKYLTLMDELDSPAVLQSYATFRDTIYSANIKSIHFNQYETYKNPVQFVLSNILGEGISLLSKLIQCYKSHPLPEFNFAYETSLREFREKTPCFEEYVRKLQGYIMSIEKKLAELPSAPLRSASSVPPPIVHGVRNETLNTVSERMIQSHFRNDGGFAKAFSPIMNLDQVIALSLLSFNLSLCNGGATSSDEAARAYNEMNYRTYLFSLRFFNNPTYHTQGLTWDGLVAYFRKNDIDLPSPSDAVSGKFCYIPALRERQQYIGIGGKGANYKCTTRKRTLRRRRKRTTKHRKSRKRRASSKC